MTSGIGPLLNIKDLLPEKQEIVNLEEVKSCWEGVYDHPIERTGGNNIHTCRNKARRKYAESVDD
jgi:hypothetical protein